MKTHHSQFFYIALSMMLCLIPTFVYAMSDYSLVRLDGELGIGLSSNGLVTGTTGAGSNPLFWNQAGMRLDSEPQPFVYGFGYAINETGLGLVDAGENGEGYFFWQNGKYTLIPLTIGVPARINNTGQVAAELPNGHVGRLSNGVLTDLGPLPGGAFEQSPGY